MKKSIKQNPDKHTDEKEWNYTDLCCMGCAVKMVFECLNSEVDYGGGNLHKCLQCGFQFYGWISAPKEPDVLLDLLRAKAFEK